VGVPLGGVAGDDLDALGGGVAAGTGRADGVGRLALLDVLGEIADQAAAARGDVGIGGVHA
jgi:hypothetical protein